MAYRNCEILNPFTSSALKSRKRVCGYFSPSKAADEENSDSWTCGEGVGACTPVARGLGCVEGVGVGVGLGPGAAAICLASSAASSARLWAVSALWRLAASIA